MDLVVYILNLNFMPVFNINETRHLWLLNVVLSYVSCTNLTQLFH